MRELRLIALGNLAREHGLPSDAAALAMIERAGTCRPALDLWTYFHEMDRRTNFASQGTAVHGIWQSLPKEQRENLSALDIVRARDVLLKEMQADPLFPERIA